MDEIGWFLDILTKLLNPHFSSETMSTEKMYRMIYQTLLVFPFQNQGARTKSYMVSEILLNYLIAVVGVYFLLLGRLAIPELPAAAS